MNQRYDKRNLERGPWLKYLLLSFSLGVIIEAGAWLLKLYVFHPWWLVFPILAVLWGLIFGSIAMVLRGRGFLVQYLPGFILLFAGELLNHYYAGAWSFPKATPAGNAGPVLRALVLGMLTGFFIPAINVFMKMSHETHEKHEKKIE